MGEWWPPHGMFLSAWISAGAASGAGAHPTWGVTGLALSPEKECGIHLITSLRMQEAVLPSEAVEMSGRSQGRFFLSAGVAGIQAGQSRTLVLPPTTVSLAPGQAGAAQLPKETHPQGTDRAFCKPKFEMKVLDILHTSRPFTNPSVILQQCRTFYKPFQGCKAVFAGNGAFQWASAHRQVAGLVGREYVPHLPSRDLQAVLHPLPVPVSHLILAISQSHFGAVLMEVRMPLGASPLMVGALLWRRLLLAGGSPDTSEGCYQVSQDCLMALKMVFPLWLGRLTAQWSVEDEEEAARERRRREREKQLRSQAEEGLNGTVSCSESAALAQENQ